MFYSVPHCIVIKIQNENRGLLTVFCVPIICNEKSHVIVSVSGRWRWALMSEVSRSGFSLMSF